MKESTSYIIAFTAVLFTSLFGQYFTASAAQSPWYQLEHKLGGPNLSVPNVSGYTSSIPQNGIDSRISWYACIKPNIAPSNWVFPVVWTILYVLLAIAFARVLDRGIYKDDMPPTDCHWYSPQCWDKHKIQTIGFWIITFILHVLWCYLYFTQQNILQALLVLFLTVWVGVMLLANAWQQSDMVAVGLLSPYVLWIVFAVVLNLLSLKNASKCSSIVPEETPMEVLE